MPYSTDISAYHYAAVSRTSSKGCSSALTRYHRCALPSYHPSLGSSRSRSLAGATRRSRVKGGRIQKKRSSESYSKKKSYKRLLHNVARKLLPGKLSQPTCPLENQQGSLKVTLVTIPSIPVLNASFAYPLHDGVVCISNQASVLYCIVNLHTQQDQRRLLVAFGTVNSHTLTNGSIFLSGMQVSNAIAFF